MSASTSFRQIGRISVASIPPRMNISCPVAVVLYMNITVLCIDDGGVVVGAVVMGVVVVGVVVVGLVVVVTSAVEMS